MANVESFLNAKVTVAINEEKVRAAATSVEKIIRFYRDVTDDGQGGFTYSNPTTVPLAPEQSLTVSWYENRDLLSRNDVFVALIPCHSWFNGTEYKVSMNFEQEYGGYAFSSGDIDDEGWQLYQYTFIMPADSTANAVVVDSLGLTLRLGHTRHIDDICINYGEQRTMPDGIGYLATSAVQSSVIVANQDNEEYGYEESYEGITATSLYNQMSSFYHAYVSDDAFIKTWFKSLVKVFNFVDAIADQVRSNNLIDRAELLRTVPFQGGWLSSSLYDIIALKESYPDWDTMGIGPKVKVLDSLGLYDKVDASRAWDETMPAVNAVTIDRKVATNEAYSLLTDYVIRDNKLYLLSGIAQPIGIESKIGKPAPFKDIEIDYSTLWNRWGKLLRFSPPPDVTKEEYRNILIALLRAFMQGPRMEVLQRVLEDVTGWQDVHVYDYYSIDNPKKWVWGSFMGNTHARDTALSGMIYDSLNEYDGSRKYDAFGIDADINGFARRGMIYDSLNRYDDGRDYDILNADDNQVKRRVLTPFDFLISIPDYLSVDWVKTKYLWNLMQIIKESHTNFIFLYEKEIIDEGHLNDDIYARRKMLFGEKRVIEMGLVYDRGDHYDSGIRYDSADSDTYVDEIHVSDEVGLGKVLSFEDGNYIELGMIYDDENLCDTGLDYDSVNANTLLVELCLVYDNFNRYDEGRKYDLTGLVDGELGNLGVIHNKRIWLDDDPGIRHNWIIDELLTAAPDDKFYSKRRISFEDGYAKERGMVYDSLNMYDDRRSYDIFNVSEDGTVVLGMTYDGQDLCDMGLDYDIVSSGETAVDQIVAVDEFFFSRKTFPEIPRNINASYTGGGAATVQVRDNGDGTESFEVWRSIGAAPYALTGIKSSTHSALNTVTFNDTGLPTGQTVKYKVKSYSASIYSAYTPEVTILT